MPSTSPPGFRTRGDHRFLIDGFGTPPQGDLHRWGYDTIACITGGIAETYYNVPNDITKAYPYLPREFLDVIEAFYKRYGK